MISPIHVEDPDVRPRLEQRGRDRDLREGRDRQHDGEDQDCPRIFQRARARRRRRTLRRARAPSLSATTARVAQRLGEVGVLEDVRVVLSVGWAGTCSRQVVAGLERDVDEPIEREEAENDDRDARRSHPPRHLDRSCGHFFWSVRARCGLRCRLRLPSPSPPPVLEDCRRRSGCTRRDDHHDDERQDRHGGAEPVDPVRGERLLRDR